MRRGYLTALLFATSALWGDPCVPRSAAVDPLGLIGGCVSVFTGDYIETRPDVVVNCHEPIALWRVHVSDGHDPKQHATWRIGSDKIETFIRHKKLGGHVFYREDETGTVVSYRIRDIPEKWSLRNRGAEWWIAYAVTNDYSNTSSGELSGATNLQNEWLVHDRDNERFILYRGDGEQRTYVHFGKWSRRGIVRKFVGFCNWAVNHGWRDCKHETFVLQSVRRPNGNRVVYQYDEEGRPVRIYSTNADGSVRFGSISIKYSDYGAEVATSDGQEVIYQLDYNDRSLASVTKNGVVEQRYEYNHYGCNNLLSLSHRYEPCGQHRFVSYYFTGEQAPHGERIFLRDGDYRLGRASQIYECRGLNGELVPTCSIYYRPNGWGAYTYDGLGNKTDYRIVNNRLVGVTYCDGETPIKNIHQTFSGSDLVSQKVQGGSERRFTYDGRHNVTAEYLDEQLIRSCAYNHLNLISSETIGNLTTTYNYKPNTNLVTSKQTFDGETLIREERFAYDHNAALIRQEVLSGPQHLTTLYTNRADGLPLIIEERADSLLRRTHLHYDEANRIIQSDTYDANGQCASATQAPYDCRSRTHSSTEPLGHQTRYTYDDCDRILTTTDTKTTTLTYDSGGRLTTTTVADLTTQTHYDVANNPITTLDPYQHTTHRTFDALNRPVAETLPTGAAIRRTYDGHDRITSETDPLDHTTTTTYTPRGQPLHITYPDGTSESFAYNTAGHLTSHTATNGVTTTYQRDALGRELSCTTPHSHTTTTYNGEFLASQTNALGLTTTYSYDQAGRLIAEQTPETSITYTYDALGRLATKLENDQRLTAYTYDHLNRPTSQQGFALTTYTYDPDGNLLSQTTGPSTTINSYDPHGRLLSTTDPCGATTTHAYLPDLLITSHPNGTQTHTHLDPLGQPLCIEKHTDQLLSRTTYAYDLAGNCLLEDHHRILHGQTLGHYTLHRTFDPCHRLLTLSENNTRTTTHTYNQLGQLATTTHPDGTIHQFTYDSSGRLASNPLYTYAYDAASNPVQAGDTHRTYDPYSRLTSETLANGLTLTYTYDPFHRPLSITLPDQTQTLYTYDAYHLTAITRPTYTHRYLAYDHLDQPTLEALPLSRGQRTTTYDPCGRVTSIDNQTYAYDLSGNLLPHAYDPLNQLVTDQPFDSLHNPPNTDTFNQLTAFPHDARGRPTTYTFDTFNRLTQTTHATYTYDAFHRRISKTTPEGTTHYLWTDLLEIGAYTDHLIEYRPLGLTPNAELASAPAFELHQTTHIPTYDNRGSVIALDDTPISYTPFGTPSSTPCPWLFSSKRYDPETNLTYFGRRYYSSIHQRFLTPDPLGHTSGPNLYAYCNNNPYSLIDPYGLFEVRPHHFAESRAQTIAAYTLNIAGIRAPILYQPISSMSVDQAKRKMRFHPFETHSSNRSFNDYTYHSHLPALSHGAIGFTNGQLTTLERAHECMDYLATLAYGHRIEATYNATLGLAGDLTRSVSALNLVASEPVNLIMERWTEFFSKPNNTSDYLEICHSQGTAHVRNALILYRPDYAHRIQVLAVCPASFIWPETCRRVRHLVSDPDFVPKLDFGGRFRVWDTITVLQPHPMAVGMDHDFMSPTFRRNMTIEVDGYIENQMAGK